MGSKTYSSTSPELSQEQKNQIAATTGFLTQNIIPAYSGAVKGATDIYNQNAPGLTNAAQQLGGIANQAKTTLGETGESALRTGVTGLESLFSPDYEAKQIAAAMTPAEAQYQQNIANQGAQFGGAGELGSARQALAGRQLAGLTQAQQAQTAAQIQAGIAQQRASAASNLAQLGQGGLGQAVGAAGQQVTAAMTPQQLYNQYASVIFGTPASSYTGNFTGAQGKTTTGGQLNFGNPFAGL
jgi:hypothetical protein